MITVDTRSLIDLLNRMNPNLLHKAQVTIMQGLVPVIAQEYAQNFRDGGPGWKPNSQITKLSKRSELVLRNTGLLMKSVTTPMAPYNIVDVREKQIIWGTQFKYASILRHGGVILPKKAKALFIPITTKAKKAYANFKGGGKPPTTKKGKVKSRKAIWGEFGKDYVFAKKAVIPARDYLALSPANWKNITDAAVEMYLKYMKKAIRARH